MHDVVDGEEKRNHTTYTRCVRNARVISTGAIDVTTVRREIDFCRMKNTFDAR